MTRMRSITASPLAMGVAVALAALTASALAHLALTGAAVALVAVAAAGVSAGYATSGSV